VKNMKKLIVNADDFGLDLKINQGIIQAHKNGVVTSASLLGTGNAFNTAVTLAKGHSDLAIGIHFDLDKFFVKNPEKESIRGFIVPKPSVDEITFELKRQLDMIKSAGLEITHISSRDNTHLENEIIPIVCAVAKEYNIRAIRFSRKFFQTDNEYDRIKNIIDQYNLVYASHFIAGWYWGNIDEEFTTAELRTNPGYGELWREYELATCIDPRLKEYLLKINVQLITFKDLITPQNP